MDPRPEASAMTPRDVEALMVMSEVALRASGAPVAPRTASPTATAEPPQVGALAQHSLGHILETRRILASQQEIGATRFALPKRVVLRASRLFTHKLVAAVQALADAVETLLQVHNESLDEVERMGNALRAQLATAEIAAQDAVDSLAGSITLTEPTDVRAGARDASRLALLEARLEQVERELRQERAAVARLATPGLSTRSRPSEGPSAAGVIDDETYAAFESRFRGTRSEIRARQEDALRFVAHLVGTGSRVLDIGAGRGEWIAVLRDAQIEAYGVDLNASMVEQGVGDGLDLRCEDAASHLLSLPDGELGAVTAFHFAEHVPIPVLTAILDAAYRALAAGGVMVLETPNPTNLVVGAAAFYLDPTHLRPLHPDFLAFLLESRGFTDVQVHYVHPVIENATADGLPDDARLRRLAEAGEWALFGAQDYVVVGRKGDTEA